MIDEKLYDTFKKKIVDFSSKLIIDDPRKKGTFVGPIINREAYDKFQRIMETVPADKVLLGGKKIPREGFYVENTILDNVGDPNIERVELFLPILALKPIKSLQEAVDLVNSMEYGLTGGIFSEDKKLK